MDDFDQALAMHEEALKIQSISLPSNHHSTAETYRYIAWIYEQMNKFELSLKNYTIAFDMLKLSSQINHRLLVQIQEDIDNVKKSLNHGSRQSFLMNFVFIFIIYLFIWIKIGFLFSLGRGTFIELYLSSL